MKMIKFILAFTILSGHFHYNTAQNLTEIASQNLDDIIQDTTELLAGNNHPCENSDVCNPAIDKQLKIIANQNLLNNGSSDIGTLPFVNNISIVFGSINGSSDYLRRVGNYCTWQINETSGTRNFSQIYFTVEKTSIVLHYNIDISNPTAFIPDTVTASPRCVTGSNDTIVQPGNPTSILSAGCLLNSLTGIIGKGELSITYLYGIFGITLSTDLSGNDLRVEEITLVPRPPALAIPPIFNCSSTTSQAFIKTCQCLVDSVEYFRKTILNIVLGLTICLFREGFSNDATLLLCPNV